VITALAGYRPRPIGTRLHFIQFIQHSSAPTATKSDVACYFYSTETHHGLVKLAIPALSLNASILAFNLPLLNATCGMLPVPLLSPSMHSFHTKMHTIKLSKNDGVCE
jgi:hypothetical protein